MQSDPITIICINGLRVFVSMPRIVCISILLYSVVLFAPVIVHNYSNIVADLPVNALKANGFC